MNSYSEDILIENASEVFKQLGFSSENCFTETFRKILTNYKVYNSQILLRKTRDLLLPKLMSGKIDVEEIVERVPSEELKVWKNKRGSDERVLIWFEAKEYVVILSERNGYLLLWTEYPVTRSHRKRKFEKEYQRFKNAEAGN